MPAWFPSFPLEVPVTQPAAGATGWGGPAQPASAEASGTTDQV